jgi:hypothetical protein
VARVRRKPQASYPRLASRQKLFFSLYSGVQGRVCSVLLGPSVASGGKEGYAQPPSPVGKAVLRGEDLAFDGPWRGHWEWTLGTAL